MTEPRPLPEWALERAQKALGFETPNDELAPWLASKFRELRNDVAAALVAARRETLLEAADAAIDYAAEAERNCRNERGPTESPWSAANRVSGRIRALADKAPVMSGTHLNPCRRPAQCTDHGFGPENCAFCNPPAAPLPYDKDRDLAEANTRRLALADEVGRLRGTIRRALAALSGIEKVSATGSRVARLLRDALGEEGG